MATNKKRSKPVDIYVGARVRMRRQAIGMSQQKLGDTLGVTFQQVQKYEAGTNRISASRLQQIAHALEVSIPFFFEGAPDQPRFNGGEKKAPSPDYVSRFLKTDDGLALVRAFTRIKDARTRRKILAVIHELGES